MHSNLNKLIKKYDPPIALIDNWQDQFIGYAIWDFEETLEWNYEGLYLSGKKQKTASLDKVQKILDIWKTDNLNQISAVGYISYDMKNIIHVRLYYIPAVTYLKIRECNMSGRPRGNRLFARNLPGMV